MGPHTDGVEADVVECGDFGCALRIDRSLVVDAVGEKDDDFALGFAVFDSIDGGGETVAESGAVFHHAVFEGGQLFEQHVVVNGERHLCECFTRKDHQPHAIGFAPVNKVGGHFLGGFQSVGFEVLGQHTAAHVHSQDDVDAFYLHLLAAEHALRPGEGNDDGTHSYHAEDEEQRIGPLPEGLVHAFEETDIGELQCRFLLAVA